ncbi:hypothetical protein K6T82_20495 [Flavobacterium sp. 17A]|uniref:Lipocalin-like domain-containing protein n=1 Tax=Flavobacterium potami TaxID=2872310 RepID=A0A9X1HDI1_9FLAO|nr:hypothetical protein [Flavobacterium potami]MBZ4037151.1 hypothetical protein [Flavobacterium potami]
MLKSTGMRISHYLFCCSFFLLSCKKENKEQKSVFVKTWYDTEMDIPYMARLEINKDHTFKFVGGACTTSFHSDGNWIEKNDTLILNSVLPKECFQIHEFGKMCYSKEEIEKIRFTKTIADCEPKNEDSFENFKDEKFYLRNDSLVLKKDRKEKCTERKIVFFKYKKQR